MIKALLFDMGGTIIEASDPPKAYEIHQKILLNHGVKRTIDQIAKAHKKAGETLDINLLPLLRENYWIQFNLLLLNELEIKRDNPELARIIRDEWENHVSLKAFSDVSPILKLLRKRKIKLGIISNCLESELNLIIQKLGFESLFDIKVAVDTFMLAKPNKDVFLYTLKKLSVAPEEALFVGDCPEKDYSGAKNAGLKALLIDRTGGAGNQTHVIQDFNGIIPFLQQDQMQINP